jgi:SIR2-like protein
MTTDEPPVAAPPPEPAPTPPVPELAEEALADLCGRVAMRIREGKVIPFLGAGANLVDRPPPPVGYEWEPGEYLPNGTELAAYLARIHKFPRDEAMDLVRVAQFVDLRFDGEAVLFENLRGVFTRRYEPNRLHRLLAMIPEQMRAEKREPAHQLIVTTNYDDVLEQAFDEADEEYDVLYYVSDQDRPGRFVHRQPDGTRGPPAKRGTRTLSLNDRTLILKIHGAVDRESDANDSYVITEDHYIDFVARARISKVLPGYVMARMTTSHFLFLGYGMRDWNLRVILHHIWSEQRRRFGSWAVQYQPHDQDVRFWQRHRVEVVNVRLERWVDAMHRQLQ